MLDLDKKRAARREVNPTGPKVRLGGKTFELAPEMPYEVLEQLALLQSDEAESTNAMTRIAQLLLNSHYEEFLAANPSVDDFNDLLEGVMGEYGVATEEDTEAPKAAAKAKKSARSNSTG